jgi:hypothetical protein
MGDIITLLPRRSQREPTRRIFSCIGCGGYSFKLLEIDGADHIACANCETWIREFELVRTRDDL